jgi:hypothetical protein
MVVDIVRAVRSRLWLRALRPSVILAVGWASFVLVSYPGVMTMDSFDQLEEARAGFFTDSHPPAMAALWSVVDRICAGPFGMLAIQGTAFLIGLYWILRRAMSQRVAALVACVVLLYPPVLATMTVIWKDCLMAGFLVLGYGAVFDARRGVRIAALVAFFVATAMRYNAFAATLPLIVLRWEWRPGLHWLKRYALAAAAWLAVTLAAFGINAALTDRAMHFWASTYALSDIAGTLAHVDETIPDSELAPLLTPTRIAIDHDFHEAIRAKYRPETFTQLIGGDDRLWTVPIAGTMPAPTQQRQAIEWAWRAIIGGHIGAYVQYRFSCFAEVLGLRAKFNGATVIRRKAQTPERLAANQISTTTLPLQRFGERAMVIVAKQTFLFRPWLYALIALALLAFCRGHRDIAALLASGLLMELSLLALAVTPDYRYSHWLVVCTCLAVPMLIARRANAIGAV